mgnify:CR=1 FL=1
MGMSGPVVLVSDHHHVRGAAYCLAKTYPGDVYWYQVPSPHRGYSYEFSEASDLPEPQVQRAPIQCESGYYFWCC